MKSFTAIIANGDFPRKGSRPWEVLKLAAYVVACDGAAEKFYRRFHRRVDCVIGDFDSVCIGRLKRIADKVVHVAEQDTNDLTKAVNWCKKSRRRNLKIFGAAGRRDDHALGNIFRAMEAGVEIILDYGTFVPFQAVKGGFRFRAQLGMGRAISFFTPHSAARMKSRGLEWPLDEVRFSNLYCATLNRTTSAEVAVSSTHPAFVYIAHS